MPDYEIFVNNKRFVTTSPQLSGNGIKQLANVPQNYELFLIHGNQSEPIGPDQTLEIKNGEHFRAIPPGTFGIHASTSTFR